MSFDKLRSAFHLLIHLKAKSRESGEIQVTSSQTRLKEMEIPGIEKHEKSTWM
jgi:hypothetical protein